MSQGRSRALRPAGRVARAGALTGHIAVPGDKSISHRALILGGMAEGETRIEGLLEGQDVLHTAAAVRALGAKVTRLGEGLWTVPGAPTGARRRRRSTAAIRAPARGCCSARLPAIPIEATFTGDASLRGRPMKRVLDPLRQMGAETGDGDRLPVTIRGGGLHGISLSQPECFGPGQIGHPARRPARRGRGRGDRAGDEAATIREKMLARLRLRRRDRGQCASASAPTARLKATDIMVPGDPSSAAFPLVAALIVPDSEVTVHGVLTNPLRTGLFETLIEMGADLSFANRRIVGGEEVADVTARTSILTAVEVDPDAGPVDDRRIPDPRRRRRLRRRARP